MSSIPLLIALLIVHVLCEPLPAGQDQTGLGNPPGVRVKDNSVLLVNNNIGNQNSNGNKALNADPVSVTKSPKKKRKKKKSLSSKIETKGLKSVDRVQNVPDNSFKGFAQNEIQDVVKNSKFKLAEEKNENSVLYNGESSKQRAQNVPAKNVKVQNLPGTKNAQGYQENADSVNKVQSNRLEENIRNSLNVSHDNVKETLNVPQGNVHPVDQSKQNLGLPNQNVNVNSQQDPNVNNDNKQVFQTQNTEHQQNPIPDLSNKVELGMKNLIHHTQTEETPDKPPPPPDQSADKPPPPQNQQQNFDTYNNNNNVNFNNNNNNNINGNNNQQQNIIFQQNNAQQQADFQSVNNQQANNLQPINVIQQQPKKEPLRIVWDWSDFLINYEQYVMPEQKVRRAPHPTTGEPWPLPQYYVSKATKIYRIDKENFRFHIVKQTCGIIEKAIERYKDMILEDTITDMYDNLQHAQGTNVEDFKLKYEDDIYLKAQPVSVVNIKIRRPCAKFPNDQMDESYDVFVKKTGSYIWANEVWGALRGLETFSQLVYRGPDDVLYIKDTVINDYPRFPHRGLHIDSSRHFIFKDVIYDILEGMAQNKMNVLHWHIVDDQSFPYQSKVFPDLSEKGAYHPSFVYSHEDIADIIEYARMRGIRVMPEFDTPGHTYSWGLSHPEIMTQCYQGAHPVNGYVGPLDPSKNGTYKFLKNLFNEILHVFKDQYIHLGGDEVPMTCWSSNPDVLKLLNTLNGKPDAPINLQNNDPYMYSYDIRKVLEYYEKRLTQDLKDLGQNRKDGVRFVMWQEIMNNNVQLPNDTIIQIWQGDMGDVQRAIDMGYNALYSTCWYLDLIEYGTKWPKYYNCDPADNTMGYQIDEKKVLGGEACLWAEYIDNENLMTTLWPRASAIAERLWSSKDVRDIEAAGRRLSEHRCRMLGRGLSVGQISGPDYCLHRGHRRDGERVTNCTGERCYPVRNVIEKFNFKVQQRGHSLADCNQIIAQGGSIFTSVVIILVLIAVLLSLKMSGSRIVQIKMCRNKTIFFAFVALIGIYFMCYTSLWIQVQEFKGSFEKRIKSYGNEKIT